MDERWKRFLFRTAVSVIGALYSYLSSATLEEVTWKIIVIVIIQALVSSLGQMPEEARFLKRSRWRKYLSWF